MMLSDFFCQDKITTTVIPISFNMHKVLQESYYNTDRY